MTPSVAVTTRRIICVGCAFWDTIMRIDAVPRIGGKVLAEEVVQNASGMATVAAVTIARLGGEVTLWSRIGDDAAGHLFLEDIARDAVDVTHVRRMARAGTWLSTILVDASGERLVVSHRPLLDPDPSWLPLHQVAATAAVLADMRWPDGARAAFAEARRHGIPTVLDADVAPADDLRRMLPLADHILFSEPALASLFGKALLADECVEPALREVAAGSAAEVVGVTLGPRGAAVLNRLGSFARVPTARIAAVDTLNAGDVWHGAYTVGLVTGLELMRRAEFANVAAAIKCMRFGGKAGAPRLHEVQARMGPSDGAPTGSSSRQPS